MDLIIDGRTSNPQVDQTYRQFIVDGDRPPMDEGAVTIRSVAVTSEVTQFAFQVHDEPWWNISLEPADSGDGHKFAQTHNAKAGWFRFWVPCVVPTPKGCR